MTYIGIDQSYSGFGLVLLQPDGSHEAALKKFDLKKFENPAHRLVAVINWLDDQIDVQATAVCMEGYANGAKFGRELAGELGGQVKTYFWTHHQTMPFIVPPTVLKKYVTGKGTAKKNEMLLGVYKRWDVEFKDDNLADAYALARFRFDLERVRVGDVEDIPKFQLELLHTIGGMPTV